MSYMFNPRPDTVITRKKAEVTARYNNGYIVRRNVSHSAQEQMKKTKMRMKPLTVTILTK